MGHFVGYCMTLSEEVERDFVQTFMAMAVEVWTGGRRTSGSGTTWQGIYRSGTQVDRVTDLRSLSFFEMGPEIDADCVIVRAL